MNDRTHLIRQGSGVANRAWFCWEIVRPEDDEHVTVRDRRAPLNLLCIRTASIVNDKAEGGC